MKYTLVFFLALTICGESIAQTIYESPHVKDGKTIQFTIPKGYYELVEMGAGNTVFTTEKDVDLEAADFNEQEIGALMVMHIAKEGEETLQSIKADMESEMDKEGITIIGKPEIINIKGKECLLAGFDGDILEEGTSEAYFSIMEFGDYFVMVDYLASKTIEKPLDYGKFKQIIASYNIVSTDKEDGMDEYEEDFVLEEDLEDYSAYFTNDLFETEISYYDILPDVGPEWEDYIDESGHLLSMFSYKKDGGFVKVFSGGSSSNYPSDEEKASAIQRAMDWDQPMTLTFKSQFSNEDHFFKLYSISGGGTMTSVYTTIVNRELVFFVVDGGNNPDDSFKPSVRDFMLTMWVDYFVDEE